MYTDTGTYVESSFTLRVPPDRTIGYSIFIRAAGLGRSLWPVVLAQACILACLLRALVCRLTARRHDAMTVALCAVLGLLTTAPLVQSTVFADALTPVFMLCLLLLLLPGGRRGAATAACAALFVFSAAAHASHLLIGAVLVAAACLACLASRVAPLTSARRIALAACLVGASCVFLSALNWRLGAGFSPLRSSHIFMTARLWEKGMLRRFLDEHCGEEEYELCRERGEIRGPAGYFLWDPRSPFQLGGGWNASHDEYRRLAWATIRAYPRAWAADCAKDSFRQFGRFNALAATSPIRPDQWAYKVLRRRYPRGFEAFAGSRQQRGTLGLGRLGAVHAAALCASLAALGAGMRLPRIRRDRRFVFLLLFSLCAVAANDAVCSSLSIVDDRYGARVVWMLPMCCFLMLIAGTPGKAPRADFRSPPSKPAIYNLPRAGED
ncbi:MAG: hypothetical protein PHN82_01135 [bacterium]|nr:hypothetical protein [bacterium]